MKAPYKNLLSGLLPLSVPILCLLATMLAGCASTRKLPPALFPILGETAEAMKKTGYTPHGRFWSYTTSVASVQISQVSYDIYEPTLIDVLDELPFKGYIFLRLEIKNLTTGMRITFNPSLTALTTNRLDYKKPLDYTDFYELVKEGLSTSTQLKSLSTYIYDSTQTISPRQTMSKFLIFPPLTDGFSTVNLDIKEIYFGTTPYSISFPFQLQEQNELIH